MLSHLYFRGNLGGLRAWAETAALSQGFVQVLGRLGSCRLCLTTWMGAAAALAYVTPTDPLHGAQTVLFGLSAGWSAFALRDILPKWWVSVENIFGRMRRSD
jgi:hypothetical protein